MDFYGVNLYEWCGKSSYESSGYDERTKEFSNYNKPVFLSEFGCNLVSPRPFTEVQAIYSKPMTDVWSGGVAYEWTQENNNYGLVKLSTSNSTAGAAHADIMADYTNLQTQLAKVNPQGEHMDTFHLVRSAPACPSHSNNWKASLNLPPTPSAKACECLKNSVSCVASDKVSVAGTNGKSTIGTQLDIMCGLTPCDEIKGDGVAGKYGAFSYCEPREKLTWLYHAYSQNNMGACDFEGNALKVTPRRKQSIEGCSTMEPSFEQGSGGDAATGNGNGDGSTSGHGSSSKSGAVSATSVTYIQQAFLGVFLFSLFPFFTS